MGNTLVGTKNQSLCKQSFTPLEKSKTVEYCTKHQQTDKPVLGKLCWMKSTKVPMMLMLKTLVLVLLLLKASTPVLHNSQQKSYFSRVPCSRPISQALANCAG